MINPDLIVRILFIEYVFIALIYIINQQWIKAMYWTGAAILNLAIIMGLK